jgi:hypothetical protein
MSLLSLKHPFYRAIIIDEQKDRVFSERRFFSVEVGDFR